MEPRKPTAERIRPILEAMERSIDSARRKRTLGDEPRRPRSDESAQKPQHSCVPDGGTRNPIASISGGSAQGPQSDPNDDPLRTESGERLKAKPKRPQNFVSPLAQSLPPFRSRAS